MSHYSFLAATWFQAAVTTFPFDDILRKWGGSLQSVSSDFIADERLWSLYEWRVTIITKERQFVDVDLLVSSDRITFTSEDRAWAERLANEMEPYLLSTENVPLRFLAYGGCLVGDVCTDWPF